MSFAQEGANDLCKVCGESTAKGPHKHILQYCNICGRETKHVTPFFGFPFTCSEKHPQGINTNKGIMLEDKGKRTIVVTDKPVRRIDPDKLGRALGAKGYE